MYSLHCAVSTESLIQSRVVINADHVSSSKSWDMLNSGPYDLITRPAIPSQSRDTRCGLTLHASHPLLKGGYTGHEKTYSEEVNISPRLAETKQNQQFLEKSVLPIFPGR